MTPAQLGHFVHKPVLCAEVVDLALALGPKTIVDCTTGGAGHAAALLTACPEAHLMGLDRDAEAIKAAHVKLEPFQDRAVLSQGRFGAIKEHLQTWHKATDDRVDMLLVDLGVSSHQLDVAERGFSFRNDAPLDMRMDVRSGPTCADLLGRIETTELANILHHLGQERFARRLARAIVNDRPTRTQELAQLVRRVVGSKGPNHIDAATKTFMALRMAVNDEMGELQKLLDAVPEILNDNGLVCAITFHSVEDAKVKQAFSAAKKGCTCPRALPVCVCQRLPTLRPMAAVVPSLDEIDQNARARSARLRVASRLPRPAREKRPSR